MPLDRALDRAAPSAPWQQNELIGPTFRVPGGVAGTTANNAAKAFMAYQDKQKAEAKKYSNEDRTVFTKVVMRYMPDNWTTKELVEEFGRDVDKMIDAYNSGGGDFSEQSIKRWLEEEDVDGSGDGNCNFCTL
jgi:hypothetical protein